MPEKKLRQLFPGFTDDEFEVIRNNAWLDQYGVSFDEVSARVKAEDAEMLENRAKAADAG